MQTLQQTQTIGSQFENVFNDLTRNQNQKQVLNSNEQTTQTESTQATQTESSQTTQKGPMKTSISRIIYFRENNSVRKRILVLKYDYNRLTKVLTYAGAMYKTQNKDDKFDKHGHTNTAKKRFEIRPIVVENFISDENINLFHQAIRKQVYIHGIRAPKRELKLKEKKQPVKKVVFPSDKLSTNAGDITQMNPVVTRITNVKEVSGNTKRNITIKYEYDRVNKVLKYGATIHKTAVNSPEPYDKKGHVATTEKRFNNKPIVVENFVDDAGQGLFNKNLRNLLFKYGTKSKTQ